MIKSSIDSLKKTRLILILIIITVGMVAGGYIYKKYAFKEGVLIEEGEYFPEEFEIPSLPGQYPFRVSSPKGVYPKFGSGIFSKRPLDVIGGVDEEIIFSIKVEDPTGISRVWLVVVGQEESIRKEVNLEKTQGDIFLGTWSGRLVLPQGLERIFWTNFYAANIKDEIRDLSLDWRPGNTCPIEPSGNLTFSSSCTVEADETCGTNDGQVTISGGTINLSGTSGHPAYLVFGTKVVLSGGNIALAIASPPAAIIIKYGKTDSVYGKSARLCAYPPEGYICGANKACHLGSCGTNYVVVLLSAAGAVSCNDKCASQGGRSCASIGTDANGTNGNYYWYSSDGGGCIQYGSAAHADCNECMRNRGSSCGGHTCNWTNCRCRYTP